MDEKVIQTQQWVNKTYKGRLGYSEIPVDGITGTATFKALIKALQIELGVAVDGDFGISTLNACPPMISANIQVSTNINYIIQGSLWCKGYNPGNLDGVFGTATTIAINKFLADAGVPIDGTIRPYILKAIMNTDGYALKENGDANIRIAQQGLNNIYGSILGLSPSNGIWERNCQKSLIKALQKELGVTADGVFGSGTLGACPTLSKTTTGYLNIKRILQWALCVNGYYPGGFTGTFGNGTYTAVVNFQTFFCLTADGVAGKDTWGALMASCGNTARIATACDCATILTSAKAQTLANAGYEIVGRYLTGTAGGISKALSSNEIDIIFNAGLKFFPIYQSGGAINSYFTSEKGISDANSAIKASRNLGIPSNTIIYFAVDYDATDEQIISNVLPYFASVKTYFDNYKKTKYQIGVYGSRNICTKICQAGYAVSSFVGNMSSGYSGNLGYLMPTNWAFDQFHTVYVGTGDGKIEIDKDSNSGRDNGVESVNKTTAVEIKDAVMKVYNKFLTALGAPTPQMPFVLSLSNEYEIPINEDLKISYCMELNTALFDANPSTMAFTIENGTCIANEINLFNTFTMDLGIDASNPSIKPLIELSATVESGMGKYEVSTDGIWLNASYIISTEVDVNEYCTQEISFTYTISVKKSTFDNFMYQNGEVEEASSKVLSRADSGEVLKNVLAVVLIIGLVAFSVVSVGSGTSVTAPAIVVLLLYLGINESGDS